MERWPVGSCLTDDNRRGRLEAVAIRTSEYTSNALMSGGCDVGCLRNVKVELTPGKNRPFWYMLSTWKGDGEKLANSSSLSLQTDTELPGATMISSFQIVFDEGNFVRFTIVQKLMPIWSPKRNDSKLVFLLRVTSNCVCEKKAVQPCDARLRVFFPLRAGGVVVSGFLECNILLPELFHRIA
uniref:Uncharacterized protein n=1 Tax=Oryza rufipogon TaxID=4529 RepID=A0A0E0N3X1_ORYRU